MPLLRGNLHAHTTFSDGVRSPAALVAEYEIARLRLPGHHRPRGPLQLGRAGYRNALDRLRPALLLFRGIEVNFDPIAQHVGKVTGDAETLWILNHPARYKLSVTETVERVEMIQAAGWPLSAIEVTDTGLYRPRYDTEAIPLVKIATDDAHRPPHFGRAWIEVDAPRDRDAIIRAIRAGDVCMRFSDR